MAIARKRLKINYYDLNRKDEFAKLFGDLEIGGQPTPSRNNYLVLELDFSGLNTSGKSELESSFRMRLANSVIGFLHKYQQFFRDIGGLESRIRSAGDVGSILDALLEEVKKTSHKVYLIIDEYDHFANDIIAMGDEDFYKELIRAAGLVRDFYETVKIGTKSVDSGSQTPYHRIGSIRTPEVKYEWLLKLKYLPKGKAGELERVKREGMEQLKRYAASQRFAGRTDLKQAVLIFMGKDEWVVV